MAKNSDAKTGQPIYGFSEPGFNHVGSYQTSARPFATASVAVPASGATNRTKIEFPGVTKFVIVRNDEQPEPGSTIRLAFASGGLGDMNANYITILPSSSFSADFRVTQLYLMCNTSQETSASVIAGITTIKSGRAPSGSWEDTIGVDKSS